MGDSNPLKDNWEGYISRALVSASITAFLAACRSGVLLYRILPVSGWLAIFSLSARLCLAQNPAPVDAAYQRGSLLYRAGDCAAAIPDLGRAGNTLRADMMLASCYIDAKDFGNAAPILEARLKAEPEDIEALSLLATVYEHTNRTNNAIQRIGTYLTTHEKDLAMWVRLARVHLAANDVSAAEVELKKAEALQPDNPVVIAAQAAAALQQKRWQEAIDLFHRAQQRIPVNLEIETGLSTAFLEQNQCPEALPPLNQAQKLAPLDYGIAKKMARCYRGLEQWNEVIRSFRTNTPEEASDSEGTAWMLDALRRSGRAAESEAYLKWVVQTAPKNQVARVALADLLFEAKRYEDAAVHYEEAARAEPAVAKYPYRLGLIAESQKKPMEARAFYEAASASADAPPEVHSALARVCLEAKDWACVRQSLDRIPATAITVKERRMRVEIEYQSKSWPEVWTQASELLAQEPDSLDIINKAAEAAKQLNRPGDQAQMLEHSVKLAPADKEARYDLVSIYTNEPSVIKVDRAEALLNDLINNYNGGAEAQLRLAEILYRNKNDLREAQFHFQLGIRSLPTPTPANLAWAFTSYAETLAKDNRPDEALENFRHGTVLNPKNEAALFNFAIFCVNFKMKEELARVRQQLLEIDTDEGRTRMTQLDEAMRSAGVALTGKVR